MEPIRSTVSSEESLGVAKCLFWKFKLLGRITPGILWGFRMKFDFDFDLDSRGTLDNSMSSSESASKSRYETHVLLLMFLVDRLREADVVAVGVEAGLPLFDMEREEVIVASVEAELPLFGTGREEAVAGVEAELPLFDVEREEFSRRVRVVVISFRLIGAPQVLFRCMHAVQDL